MGKLQPGDKIAAVSPSWGGAGEYPDRYEMGKRELETRFGVTLQPMLHTLSSAEFLAKHPEARAHDIHQAFSDPDIKAVFACIGGDDAIRVLPFLDKELLSRHPKPFLGYSDVTVLHLFLHALGVPCFYGPAILAGFAEAGGMFPYTEQAVRQMLFERNARGEIDPNGGGWSHSLPDFENINAPPRARLTSVERKCLQGTQSAKGTLIGGCFEVLEFCRGTPAWPGLAYWQDCVLFFEIADGDKYVHPDRVRWFFRSMALAGELQGIKGILMGRTGQTVPVGRFQAFEQVLVDVLAEHDKQDIPVIGRMEFGHTDPMCVLPYGAEVALEPTTCRVTLLDDILTQ